MLEHVPAWLGHLLADRRAGADKLLAVQPGMAGAARIALNSPAFADGARLPERFTADGAGISPPLTWSEAPAGARLALLVEDADAPASQPLVHAIIWGLKGEAGRLEEGAMGPDGAVAMGRNSYLRTGWLPPDPPTGHGEHRYAFQLFALSPDAPDPGEAPGRSAMIEAICGHVMAAGVLIGTYSRGEPADIGPVGAVVPV